MTVAVTCDFAGSIEAGTLRGARVSQIVLECLVLNYDVLMPPLYPTLSGLTYNVIWRPKALNFAPEKRPSGVEVRIGAAQYPLHEFELSYDFVNNNSSQWPGIHDFATMMGFQLGIAQGSLNGFLFLNPYDNAVTAQSEFTTDGVASQFGPLLRTFGYGSNVGTEPVGYVNTSATFNLYVDGVVKLPGDVTWGYTIVTTTPVNQQIKFNNTPATGHVITVDMSYWYYCRLADDSLDFNNFASKLWELKKVKLQSLRN